MELLIKNITAVTMDPANPVLKNCQIGIDRGKICWLSGRLPAEPADRVIDGAGKLAMPGLVNAHTHLPMTLLRGYADDYALQPWLHEHIFPAEDRLDARCIRAGALWGWRNACASASPLSPICISSCPPLRKCVSRRASKPACATRA